MRVNPGNHIDVAADTTNSFSRYNKQDSLPQAKLIL